MNRLIITSIIWAFSFSLIGVYLAGKVDSYIAILSRFILASLVLTPFLKIKKFEYNFLFKIMLIGALQIGMMYIFFYNSFLFLSVPEVILFTITTPIYIELIGNLKERKFKFSYILAVISSVIGALIIKYHHVNENFMTGFLMVQLCNICFGSGQLIYKYVVQKQRNHNNNDFTDRDFFAFFYYGATLFILPFVFIFSNFNKLPQTNLQYAVLLWLGIIASGIGYLLWNSGVRKVGHTLLATMNNFIIPLGIIVNFIIWNKEVSFFQFFIGSIFIITPVLILNLKARSSSLNTHNKTAL